ncbi:SRPBCC domain-containing protein [Blastococcus xanthinilyticus]|uniref:Uncharacterized protein YndB with AHSA1/START domain n=1 Tax=Blastococcus xanthinilyticus TaxID=1564164 RepID=A0A5S5D3K8_9ACTN|nr:SRPBCC domain-containing protein [Blastococcus xanthinilyticus]TYP90613.1 uncharacterized protein YndB with AHSA1/START domain [Blastococcus xanthinilyticus]
MSSTVNEPSVVDGGAFTVRRSILISAPIEKVWSAVSEPAHISRWFGRAVLHGSGVGAHGTLTFDGGRAVPVRIEHVEEPRVISYRWTNDDARDVLPEQVDVEHSTVVTFTLENASGGTRLTVVETGFETLADPAADLETHRTGWNVELDKLVDLLEGAS